LREWNFDHVSIWQNHQHGGNAAFDPVLIAVFLLGQGTRTNP